MKRFLALLFLAVLAACGGSGNPDVPAQNHVAAQPPVPTCTARVVSVNLRGDSTQYGLDSFTGARALHSPGVELQALMDTQFGPGTVIVTDEGVIGSMAHNAPAPSGADVVVANYGINDVVNGISTTDFMASMLATGATILETPVPVSDPSIPSLEAYVAAEQAQDMPVADVYGYVHSLPDWQALSADRIHPGDALYVLIIHNVLAPVVAKQVAPLRCVGV